MNDAHLRAVHPAPDPTPTLNFLPHAAVPHLGRRPLLRQAHRAVLRLLHPLAFPLSRRPTLPAARDDGDDSHPCQLRLILLYIDVLALSSSTSPRDRCCRLGGPPFASFLTSLMTSSLCFLRCTLCIMLLPLLRCNVRELFVLTRSVDEIEQNLERELQMKTVLKFWKRMILVRSRTRKLVILLQHLRRRKSYCNTLRSIWLIWVKTWCNLWIIQFPGCAAFPYSLA